MGIETRPDGWLARHAVGRGQVPALRLFGGESSDLTYAQLAAAVADLAARLRRAGLSPRDRIGLLSESHPRWAVALLAAWRCGAVVVPLDAHLDLRELCALAGDARPRLILASAAQADRARECASSVPEGCAVHGFDDASAIAALAPRAGEQSLRELDDVALVMYTSGTAGRPKGVMLTHANLAFQLGSIRELFANDAQTHCVSFLPLSHAFELTAGLLAVLNGGGRICYCASLAPEEIGAAMRRERPTMMITVPLFLAHLRNGIERRLRERAWPARLVFTLMHHAARAIPSMALRRTLFASVHAGFGGRLRYFVSGGAPLAPTLAAYFRALGFEVYQGYGLTETAPIVTANAPGADRCGSVGRPLPGVEVRSVACDAATGEREIWTRGPHVMRGYFGQPELTRSAIDADGWFRTGDLGFVDADGFLHVTGRRKNLLVLGNGKKVAPEEIEQLLERDPAIGEAVVVGRAALSGALAGTEEVCAVVVPSERLAAGSDEALEQALLEAVRRCTRMLAAFKRPTRVVVRRELLPKTTTRKVRRALVHAWLDTLEAC